MEAITANRRIGASGLFNLNSRPIGAFLGALLPPDSSCSCLSVITCPCNSSDPDNPMDFAKECCLLFLGESLAIDCSKNKLVLL
uniref:Uncharacterized protein n=1 Tax=Arundo donax TaxID=35708 RepID=A0A0A9GUS3_ARUDO